MNLDEERNAFEERFQHLDLDFVDDLGYCESETQIAWASWCAAKANEAEKLKGCVVVPAEPTDEIIAAMDQFDSNFGYADMRSAYKAMIEASRG